MRGTGPDHAGSGAVLRFGADHGRAGVEMEATPTTALITGASSGIGHELAKRFARDRARLLLVGRNPDALGAVARELASLGATGTEVIVADHAKAAGAPQVLQELGARRLEVDALVNNAGYGLSGRFASTDLASELEMIQLNIGSLTALTKGVLPAMLARRRGNILNVASTAAFQPGPFMAVYYATKAYVLSFSEALAEELSGTGVRVTTLCPGPTDTGFAARANVTGSRLFHIGGRTSAAAVAAAGYRAMKQGRRLVIPGALNQLQVQAVRISPRAAVLKIARALNETPG